jgi:predicted amidophosphoribosyltransferase
MPEESSCKDHEPIRSWTPLYLAIGQGYEVLKAWKRQPSPLADRWILRSIPALEELAKKNFVALVPVPQGPKRSWRLGRSPATQLATWLSRKLEVPVLPALEIRDGSRSQAGRSLAERLERASPFSLAPGPKRLKTLERVFGPIALVDDFVTTGRTLRQAAELLKSRAGAHEIHAVCLGLRPGRRASSPSPEDTRSECPELESARAPL